MTAAPEIPADVMAAAQRSALSWFATSEDGIYREPLTYFIARAILAERKRCVDVARAELVVDDGESYVGLDGFDVDYDRGVYAALRAIQGHNP